MTTQMGLKQIRDAVTALRPTPLEVEDRDGKIFVGVVRRFDAIVETAEFETADGTLHARGIQKIRSVT